MAFSKKIATLSLVTLMIIAIVSLTIGALPTVIAQPPRKPTYAFIGAMPNPVQVNTEVLLHIGITDATPNVAIGWEGLTVAVTKPDGTTETLGPYTTDATGGTGVVYTPTQVGTYTLQMNFPEQLLKDFTIWMPNGTVMEASSSDPLQLIVQEDPIGIWPGVPLPTEFWSRPVNAQFWEWGDIAGNWQTIPPNRFAPYNEDAPNTAHILWTKPIDAGGLAGGNLGNHGMEAGDAYEGKFYDAVVLNGVLYYNKYGYALFRGPMGPQAGVYAVDLHTGEELWFRNNTFINLGQLFYWSSFNYHGTFPYLWEVRGTTWIAYDAFTGDWAYTITDVPATVTGLYGGLGANTVLGPRNEIYAYTINNAENWMTCWNSSRVVSDAGSWGNTIFDGGRMFAGERGIEWNVTIPAGLPGVINHVLEDRIIGSDVPAWTGLADDPITFWGLSIKPGQEGQLLFKKTWTPPAGRLIMLPGPASLEDGVFIVTAKDTTSLYGFSTDTGDQIWGPTESQPYIDAYTLGEERAIPRAVAFAYGKLYSTGMAGVLYCYDAKTANLLWKYTAEDKYAEMLWSNNWPMRINFITDGKLYLSHDEHSPIDPFARGAPFIVLDAETGEEIWTIDGAFRTTEWGGSAVIGDSIIALYNSYDQRIYAVGKGPSKTTVSASDVGVVEGSSVMIKGSVMDISAGCDDPALMARFPNGVPAVSDASMSEWMKYVHLQYPMPMDAVGIEVVLETYDPNGNFYEIGRATTDSDGNYGLMWQPPVPGEYMVLASFWGSEGYYGSHATTYVGVVEAPPASPPPEPTPAPMTDTYVLGMGAAALIAIIVIGLLILLMLRRK
ncbi:MAG: PQQ-binding-like beta-propeller repeat protein [Candidatus Bathyarchaeota archaeon]|nr:PQQ-binding-like beta-propeller repeat protein [Candidatus Bathyarchaeota archaeon]